MTLCSNPLPPALVNIHFQDNDPAWLQASLPVNQGGLCIWSAGQLAPSAFLASAAASSTLAHLIFPSRLHTIPYTIKDEALLHWAQGHEQPPPPPKASHKQKSWDSPRIEAAVELLMDNAPDTRSRARLLAVTTKESGAWLSVLPVSSLGLRMDDESIRVAVDLQLGTPYANLTHVTCVELKWTIWPPTTSAAGRVQVAILAMPPLTTSSTGH